MHSACLRRSCVPRTSSVRADSLLRSTQARPLRLSCQSALRPSTEVPTAPRAFRSSALLFTRKLMCKADTSKTQGTIDAEENGSAITDQAL